MNSALLHSTFGAPAGGKRYELSTDPVGAITLQRSKLF